jgi:hypothetical protein
VIRGAAVDSRNGGGTWREAEQRAKEFTKQCRPRSVFRRWNVCGFTCAQRKRRHEFIAGGDAGLGHSPINVVFYIRNILWRNVVG